jgi:serine/threonine protein kinase
MTVKLLLMTAEGLASEAMGISRYLYSVGIRVMALNTPVPEPHQLVVMIHRCCQAMDSIQIAPPNRSAVMPSFLGGGRYATKEELGRGAFGVVHRALDTSLRRYVAIKRLAGDTSLPHFSVKLANLQTEAQTLARLSHTNIVQVYDLLREDESLFIIMEFVGGGTLKSLIDDGISLSWPLHDRVRFLIAVCRGIECAHGQGVLHLDLKPANILVAGGDSVEPKIADFGIAQLVRHDGDTARGAGGTPLYMAPEQRSLGAPVTQAADVYALAKVVNEVLTGEIGMAVDLTHEALPYTLRPVMAAALRPDPNSRLPQVAALRECLVATMA